MGEVLVPLKGCRWLWNGTEKKKGGKSASSRSSSFQRGAEGSDPEEMEGFTEVIKVK